MAKQFVKKEITQEVIETFLNGHDEQERIVNLEYKYKNDFIKVFYRNENDEKCVSEQPFYPFLWAKKSACVKLCGGDKTQLKQLLTKYGIWVKELDVTNKDGEVVKEMLDGYTFMFYATKPMSYSKFLKFFSDAKNPVSGFSDNKKNKNEEIKYSSNKEYLTVTPKEQYLISTGKRFFKGYEDYNDILRMIFDLESTGLDTKKDRIEQFGIRFNRKVKYKGEYIDFERLFQTEGETEEEKNTSELKNIITFLKIIYTFRPDVISAHNGEAFDWNLIIGACERLGTSLEEISQRFFDGESIRKDERETTLKLGGEIEKYRRTIVPNTIITDSLHAVRRAQALDSNMLFSNLKYVSKYSDLIKENRVYIPGDKISTVWNDFEHLFCFNDKTGDWYILDPSHICTEEALNKKGKDNPSFVLYTKNTILDGYDVVDGRYIGMRYLLDDLWECDMVEHRYNTPNFLICKMIPVPFEKCCTMGTAGQWKAMMLAWSYENNLAIPSFGERKTFTGGLSRLLKVGFVDNVAKFDYNSLYPSIILTWGITDAKDLMMAMLAFLEHVLTQREKYKGLKKKAGKAKDKCKEELAECKDPIKAEEIERQMRGYAQEESANDKKQLPLKIFGNSFFGSYGAPNVYPWGSIPCAERTTCTGRMALRLMIYWFSKLGYEPIVGDSFTEDTPLFIKYKNNGLIDIVPIKELINEEKIEIDELGREYDYSEKPYYVLCRSGWVEPSYIYRHKTDKDIYEIKDNDMVVEVTEDHSLFNSNKEKIKPSEINEGTNLEYFNDKIEIPNIRYMESQGKYIYESAIALAKGEIDRVPQKVLNYSKTYKQLFYKIFMENYDENIKFSKTCLAGLRFLKMGLFIDE